MARKRKVVEESIADVVEAPPKNPLAGVFAEIAGKSKGFRPARETLKRVRAVPTIFLDVDRKLHVGGWPLDRCGMIHGPSASGKTGFMHGLGLSFLRRGHMYCPVDAEMTTPIPWLETLMGEHVDNPAFQASRPKSYEQVVDDIRRIANGLAEAREKGKLPPQTSCLFAIDSIRKLVPEDIQARIKKMGAEGNEGSIDGFGGMAARMRAALNAAWLDELVPLMYHTGCSIVFIGREAEDPTASARDRQFGADWKLGGGKALFFDSSVVVRVVHAGYVSIGEGKERTVLGDRHLVEIHKTKVAAQQDRTERAYFWTSNGVATPEGFDRARDVLHVGKETGVLKSSGTWLSFDGHRWQGEQRFVEKVTPEVLDAIENACRERFTPDRIADVVQ